MTLPSSGALSFSQIQGEFGGSNPISLSEYYRGGPIVPNHGNTSPIPTSGTISVNNFYGTSATAPVPSSRTFTHQRGGVTQGALIRAGYVSGLFGGISPNPVGQISSGPNFSINRLESELQGCAGYFRFWVNGSYPNSGWTSLQCTFQAATLTVNRSSLTYTAGNPTRWENAKLNQTFANSGSSPATINA